MNGFEASCWAVWLAAVAATIERYNSEANESLGLGQRLEPTRQGGKGEAARALRIAVSAGHQEDEALKKRHNEYVRRATTDEEERQLQWRTEMRAEEARHEQKVSAIVTLCHCTRSLM